VYNTYNTAKGQREERAHCAALWITHVVTADDFCREPWLPSEPGLWVIARRLPNDFTLWRQVSNRGDAPAVEVSP
jgi:hypothetical protein